MKKLMITTAVILAGLTGMQAQMSTMKPGNPVGPMSQKSTIDPGENMLEKMKVTCILKPDQKVKIAPFVKDYANQTVENKRKCGSDRACIQSSNKSNKERFMTNMKAILSTEQIGRLNTMCEVNEYCF